MNANEKMWFKRALDHVKEAHDALYWLGREGKGAPDIEAEPKKTINFEKWKAGLTVEQASKIFDYAACRHCPARVACVPDDTTCDESFTAWANAEATE